MNQRSELREEEWRRVYENTFRARLLAAEKTGEKLRKEFQENCAEALLRAGLRLIPSDHLRDHEFVVSNGVYEAAKRICGGDS